MRKSSTNQLTVLNALASSLCNSVLGRIRGYRERYYSLNTPSMFLYQDLCSLPLSSLLWCYAPKYLHGAPLNSFMSLLKCHPFGNLLSFIGLIFLFSFLENQALAHCMQQERKLKHCHLVSCSNILWRLHWPRCCPLVILGKIVVKPSHNRSCHCWTSQ